MACVLLLLFLRYINCVQYDNYWLCRRSIVINKPFYQVDGNRHNWMHVFMSIRSRYVFEWPKRAFYFPCFTTLLTSNLATQNFLVFSGFLSAVVQRCIQHIGHCTKQGNNVYFQLTPHLLPKGFPVVVGPCCQPLILYVDVSPQPIKVPSRLWYNPKDSHSFLRSPTEDTSVVADLVLVVSLGKLKRQ